MDDTVSATPSEPRLVLVRHSLPEMRPGVPARAWHLSPEGRRRCEVLAARLIPIHAGVAAASDEPKAWEMAECIADRLEVPVLRVPGLHEHDRMGVPFLGIAEFEAAIARFFKAPEQLVFGRESAARARDRFAAAIAGIIAAHPRQSIVVVAHGTVISLFVAQVAGGDSLRIWQSLGMPSFVTWSLPDFHLIEVVPSL